MASKTEGTMWKSIKNCIRNGCPKWPCILFWAIYRENKQWPASTRSVPLKKLVLKSFVPVRRPNFNLLLMPYWSMKLKSHIYLWISYLFRALEARIYWIIANLLDDCKSSGWLQITWMITNLLDDCKSPGWLQISWIFRAYEAQISCTFSNLLDVWDL